MIFISLTSISGVAEVEVMRPRSTTGQMLGARGGMGAEAVNRASTFPEPPTGTHGEIRQPAASPDPNPTGYVVNDFSFYSCLIFHGR